MTRDGVGQPSAPIHVVLPAPAWSPTSLVRSLCRRRPCGPVIKTRVMRRAPRALTLRIVRPHAEDSVAHGLQLAPVLLLAGISAPGVAGNATRALEARGRRKSSTELTQSICPTKKRIRRTAMLPVQNRPLRHLAARRSVLCGAGQTLSKLLTKVRRAAAKKRAGLSSRAEKAESP